MKLVFVQHDAADVFPASDRTLVNLEVPAPLRYRLVECLWQFIDRWRSRQIGVERQELPLELADAQRQKIRWLDVNRAC